MSWLDTLDRLITDSWRASRDESAVMLDSLLALPVIERWDLFMSRDPRLQALSDEDHTTLFRSLNAHALIAQVSDGVGVGVGLGAAAPTAAAGDGANPPLLALAPPVDSSARPADGAAAAPAPRRHLWRRWLQLSAIAAAACIVIGAVMGLVASLFGSDGGALGLSSRIASVERDQAQIAKRLVQVDNRIGDLSSTVSERFSTAMGAIRLAAAVDQLAITVDRGFPFPDEFAQVAAVAHGNPGLSGVLKRLEDHAAAGVPTLTSLRERFEQLSPKLAGLIEVREEVSGRNGRDSGEPGVVGRVFGWIGTTFGLIEAPEARRLRLALASVRAALGLGDLAMAVRRLEDLHAYPAELVAQWLGAARSRLEVDAAISLLRQDTLPGPSASPAP